MNILTQQVEAFLDESDAIAAFSNISALLYQELENINWAGFYFMKPGELVLGPFQGKPACTHLYLAKGGVCVAGALTKETQLVPDVHLFPGHIACDGASESEIVVPILINDEVFGVLDIDAPIKNRFTQEDAIILEECVRTIEKAILAKEWQIYR